MSENFVYADLSRMTERPKCAVFFRTEDEARDFFYNAIQQLSEYVFWDLDDVLNLWNVYKEKTGFTLFVMGNDEPESISYCDEDWFRKEGYELIEFSDLCNVADIEESEQSLDFLLG